MSEKPEWASELIVEVKELKEQVKVNCSKLDNTDKKLGEVNAKLDGIGGRLFSMEASQKKTEKQLDGHSLNEIFEICTANGEIIKNIR